MQDNCITDGEKSQASSQEPERQKRGNEAARSYLEQLCALRREPEQQKPKPEPEPEPKPEAEDDVPQPGARAANGKWKPYQYGGGSRWMDAILSLFADDSCLIVYRPRMNAVTGSVTATILLAQILYWWKCAGRRPFYKFAGPCNHPLYRQGDSWQEELGFNEREFETARKHIAQKVTRGTKKFELLRDNLVIFWTDADRKTWYMVNESLVSRMLAWVYGGGQESPPEPPR